MLLHSCSLCRSCVHFSAREENLQPDKNTQKHVPHKSSRIIKMTIVAACTPNEKSNWIRDDMSCGCSVHLPCFCFVFVFIFSSLHPHSDMMQYAHSLDLLNELSPERYWQGTEIWGGCVWGGGGGVGGREGKLYLILQSRPEWKGGGGGGLGGVTVNFRHSIPCS